MGINLYRKFFHLTFGLSLYFLSLKISYFYLGLTLIFLWIGLSIFEFLRMCFYEDLPLKSLWVPLLKKEEYKNLTGAWYFLAGLVLSWLILDPRPFRIVLLILTLADPSASITGHYLGKTKFKNEKTLEGSLAFFITSLLIVYFFVKNLSFYTILFCLIMCIAEFFTKRDNFWIPLTGSLYLKLLAF